MKIEIQSSPNEVAEFAAKYIAERIKEKPEFVLGCATGGTVVLLYQKLVEYSKLGLIDFSHVVTFNLDEYVGLPREHSQSYYTFMSYHLFSHVNIPEDNIHILNGGAKNLKDECEQFEELITKSGGIDLQILGIGRNGHIAFNEPGSFEDTTTRIVDLNYDTILANSDGRFFSNSNEVPRQALTMGVATILNAKEILLLATSGGKSEAIALAVNGPVTPLVPASFLQKHSKCTFIIDDGAASRLKNK